MIDLDRPILRVLWKGGIMLNCKLFIPNKYALPGSNYAWPVRVGAYVPHEAKP